MGFNTLYDPACGISRADYIGNRINGINPTTNLGGFNAILGYKIMRIVYNEVSNEVLNFNDGGKV